jgi:hypothetical protein
MRAAFRIMLCMILSLRDVVQSRAANTLSPLKKSRPGPANPSGLFTSDRTARPHRRILKAC